ncbi:MAG: hypothetical protein GY850_28260 [bacterium]|nr:hypothetical protein [bacterium]
MVFDGQVATVIEEAEHVRPPTKKGDLLSLGLFTTTHILSPNPAAAERSNNPITIV